MYRAKMLNDFLNRESIMKDSVLVLAEVTDGKMMAPSFSETLRAGQQIAQANESAIHALVLGHIVVSSYG